jgi:hypothetical protein
VIVEVWNNTNPEPGTPDRGGGQHQCPRMPEFRGRLVESTRTSAPWDKEWVSPTTSDDRRGVAAWKSRSQSSRGNTVGWGVSDRQSDGQSAASRFQLGNDTVRGNRPSATRINRRQHAWSAKPGDAPTQPPEGGVSRAGGDDNLRPDSDHVRAIQHYRHWRQRATTSTPPGWRSRAWPVVVASERRLPQP